MIIDKTVVVVVLSALLIIAFIWLYRKENDD